MDVLIYLTDYYWKMWFILFHFIYLVHSFIVPGNLHRMRGFSTTWHEIETKLPILLTNLYI